MSKWKEKLAIAASKANSVLSKTNEYTKVIGALTRPSLHNYVAAANELLSIGTKDIVDSNFNVKNFEEVEFVSGRMSKTLKGHLLSKGKIISAVPKTDMLIVEIHGMPIVVSKDHGSIYISKDQNEHQAKAAIARLLWEEHNGIMQIYSQESYYIYVDDSLDFPTASSEHATKLTEYVKKYMDAGKSRSLFIHGVPGTGKTTVANTICKNLSKRTLFVNTQGISSQVVTSAIKDLSPEAVILNEIDKSDHLERQLESLESINRNIKLLIAVSNTVNKVPAAILRPGRFSDIIHIESLDEATLDKVMKFPCSEELRKEIRTWPIAYISEINDRMEVGVGKLEDHVAEMRARVAKMRSSENEKNDISDDDSEEPDGHEGFEELQKMLDSGMPLEKALELSDAVIVEEE